MAKPELSNQQVGDYGDGISLFPVDGAGVKTPQ
jgi:hypothetical protein